MAAYQAARDRLSLPLLRASDTLAAQQWSGDEVGAILRAISDANSAEAHELSLLPPPAAPDVQTSIVHPVAEPADPSRPPHDTSLEPI
jgi:hypothetical protein